MMLRPEAMDHEQLVGLAFDEIRIAATGLPTVCVYILELLHLLDVSIPDEHHDARSALRQQAALVRASADLADLTDHDTERIRDAHDQRFGPAAEHRTS